MKARKRILVFLRKVHTSLKKAVRYKRMYHPFENIKARKYLHKNKPKIININNNFLKINFVGKISKDILKKINFKNISEFKDSLNFFNFNGDIINTNFYGHFNNDLVIFKNKKNSLGYISFVPKNNFKFDFNTLKKLILSAKISKVDFILVYIKNNNNLKEWDKTTNITKILGRLGADYIVFNNNNLCRPHVIKTYRYDKPTYIIKSIEDFDNNKDYNIIVHLGINLENIKEVYQYYFLINNKNNVDYLKENTDLLITKYNKLFGNLKEKDKLLLFEDIFKILKIPFPKKYNSFRKIEVKKICSKFSEVHYNDVLFLLEPYRYKNDLTTATDDMRLKQACRAKDRGALFIFSYLKLNNSIPHTIVDNVREKHIELCSYLHKKNKVFTIAVTGSVGKTTTKEMLASVLSQKYDVLKSLKNSNLQIKMGLNIQNIQPINDIFIQEVGGGRPGGASRHSRMISPDMAVVTNIGTAHLGNFKNQEDLMNNKLGIMDGFNKDSIFFQNLDDEYLQKAKIKNRNVVTYSVKNEKADYYASDVKFHNDQSLFNINVKKTGKKVAVKLNTSGIHNVLNAVLCYAMADSLKLTDKQIIKGLAEFKTEGIRQNLISIAGQKILFDCYNASLSSVKSALSRFDKLEIEDGGKKIAILGDVTGVGESEEEIHKAIALELTKYKFDEIVLHGKSIKITSDALSDMKIKHHYFPITYKNKFHEYLKENIHENDIVLLKGSSKVELEYQVDLLYGTNYTTERLIEEGEFQTIPGINYKYRIFNKYAMLVSFKGHKKNITIYGNVYGKKNKGIFSNCFKGNPYIEKVDIRKNNTYIGVKSFENCKNLKILKMSSIKFIDRSAFEGCVNLTDVFLNEGLLQISERSFYGCKNLKELYIPKTVKQIDKDAFTNCPNICLICDKNSYVAKYAEENNIKYIVK